MPEFRLYDSRDFYSKCRFNLAVGSQLKHASAGVSLNSSHECAHSVQPIMVDDQHVNLTSNVSVVDFGVSSIESRSDFYTSSAPPASDSDTYVDSKKSVNVDVLTSLSVNPVVFASNQSTSSTPQYKSTSFLSSLLPSLPKDIRTVTRAASISADESGKAVSAVVAGSEFHSKTTARTFSAYSTVSPTLRASSQAKKAFVIRTANFRCVALDYSRVCVNDITRQCLINDLSKRFSRAYLVTDYDSSASYIFAVDSRRFSSYCGAYRMISAINAEWPLFHNKSADSLSRSMYYFILAAKENEKIFGISCFVDIHA